MYLRSIVIALIALVLSIGVATGGSLLYWSGWDPGYDELPPPTEGRAPQPDDEPPHIPADAPTQEPPHPSAPPPTDPPNTPNPSKPPAHEGAGPSQEGAQLPPGSAPDPSEGTTPAPTPPAPSDGPGSPSDPPPALSHDKPVRRVPVEANEVFLTFDDGPSRYTEQIATYLHEQGIPATFFWLGSAVNDGVRTQVLDLGHQLGSHTMTHARLTLLEDDIHRAEMSVSQEKLGGSRYFRPPFGAYNEKTLAFAQELGMTVVMWDVDSRDWELAQEPERIIQNVLSNVRPGSIILLHERVQTAEVLPQLIEALRTAGYTFGALPEQF